MLVLVTGGQRIVERETQSDSNGGVRTLMLNNVWRYCKASDVRGQYVRRLYHATGWRMAPTPCSPDRRHTADDRAFSETRSSNASKLCDWRVLCLEVRTLQLSSSVGVENSSFAQDQKPLPNALRLVVPRDSATENPALQPNQLFV